MNNHFSYCSLSMGKYPLTKTRAIRRMKSLTKTCTGCRTRQIKRIFYAYLLASLRLYDGLRRPNKTPSGNKSRRVQAVSDTRHPKWWRTLKLCTQEG